MKDSKKTPPKRPSAALKQSPKKANGYNISGKTPSKRTRKIPKKTGRIKAAMADVDVVESNTKETSQISAAISKALHRCRDIEAAAKFLVPLCSLMQNNMWKSASQSFDSAKATASESQSQSGKRKSPEIIAAELDEAILCLERLGEANLAKTLLTSLFLGLFSAYDAFTGALLKAIYKKRPELVDSLNIQVPLNDLLKFENISDIKESVIADEIENFRRKSYVEQFEQLEKRFGIELRKFDHWVQFVELGQRRNLITHCEGLVSKQYLKCCQTYQAELSPNLKEGDYLSVDYKYLNEAALIIYEVCAKLGQTLWRKLFPDELEEANNQLTDVIFESLRMERWERAIMLSEFASTQRQPLKDLDKKIQIINRAIGLKFSGDKTEFIRLLDATDWSASIPEFQLANSVLRENTEEACEVMRTIGVKGTILTQKSYHVWPLFKEFRKTKEFLECYHSIYEEGFAVAAAETAGKPAGSPNAADSGISEFNDEPDLALPPLHMIRTLIG